MVLLVVACEKEIDFEKLPQQKENQSQPQQMTGRFPGNPILADYRNGRLVFETQAAFDQTIATLKNMPESELRTIFGVYYESGFIPLYPYYQENETDKIVDYLQKKKALLPPELEERELEFDDPLISDDLFASLLNYKREIVLEGEIYKYTFSGALIAEEKDSLALKNYVDENNINDFIPDPRTLPAGRIALTPVVDGYVTPNIVQPPPCLIEYSPGNPIPVVTGNCGFGSSSGPTSNPQPDPNYTSSLVNYIDDLEPCNYDDAGIFGMTPFGTRKVCYEEFTGGKRRTKSLYSNEDYGFYKAIQVKIKHQRHHHIDVFGTTIASWWATKVTDEVALVINDAVFRITPPNMNVPPPSGLDMSIADINAGNMIFYSDGKVVDPTASAPEIYSWPVPWSEYPETPFNEEVIVQFFNENISFSADMDTTVDQVTSLFWNSVYDLAVAAGNKVDTSGETTKITMLLSSPTSTIVHYVDLSRRQVNTKKINYVLDDDWGAKISFNISLNSSGQVITDPEMIGTHTGIDFSYGVEAGDLTDFDDIYMNFTGVSRRNAEWKGSNMVYKALNQN
ncbi:MAG TPA: hypothetical protein VFM65_04115 [Flavobacteriaceae bacterium]|nr:hypothetical protein [Flavobacteriaceae bacterium]